MREHERVCVRGGGGGGGGGRGVRACVRVFEKFRNSNNLVASYQKALGVGVGGGTVRENSQS